MTFIVDLLLFAGIVILLVALWVWINRMDNRLSGTAAAEPAAHAQPLPPAKRPATVRTNHPIHPSRAALRESERRPEPSLP